MNPQKNTTWCDLCMLSRNCGICGDDFMKERRRHHRERRHRRKLTPTVMTASFSKESALK